MNDTLLPKPDYKKLYEELRKAIQSNAEECNIPTENGRDDYVPIVRLQYIAEEMYPDNL